MERIRTIVREKRIFYNVEDFCNAFNVSYWDKCYKRFKKCVEGQKRCGFFGMYDFLFKNQYIEIIHGATGEHKNLYCTKELIQEVLRIEVEEVF